MRVVLSWSGERSRTVAHALWEWLPRVLYFVDPWMSDRDIHAGQRWQQKVAAALDEAGFGILCVTRESVNAPWLIYEAGALSRTPVVPLLIGVPAAHLTGPLAQFQARTLDRQGCHDLVVSINATFGSLIERSEIDGRFDERWPELAGRLAVHPPEPRPQPLQNPPERDATPAGPAPAADPGARPARIPTEALRNRVEQAIQNSSLRQVARQVGMSPGGLKLFVTGTTPYSPTLRRLNQWYVRSQSATMVDAGPIQPVSLLRERAAQAVQERSLRAVARAAGVSPTSLQRFVNGSTPYSALLRKINLWYLHSVYPHCWTAGNGWDLSGAGAEDGPHHTDGPSTDDEENGRAE
jgi:transcriptional regulator with XRE-family HTH domain